MAIVVDGVTIQECKGVSTDNVNTTTVRADTTTVYTESCCTPGSASWTAIGTHEWIVPQGVTSVELCMIGAGGSGGSVSDDAISRWAGGGHGGAEITQTVNVTPGETITVVVGKGGDGVTYDQDGKPGTDSKFGTIIASGGEGGIINLAGTPVHYGGNGGSRNTCIGTFYDGIYELSGGNEYWGGQAGWSNGTSGGAIHNAGTGAGTGANYSPSYTGNGGRGEVRISWNC